MHSLGDKAIGAELIKNSYPGRGIAIGRSDGGGSVVIAYFIMGRSENSRNRIFVEDGLSLRTQAHDPGKMTDPSLIIYSPVKVLDRAIVVTNGDQTDTICRALDEGSTFEAALRSREYEPDAPNYTPRISGMVDFHGGAFSYKLSILKRGEYGGCERFFYEYQMPAAGEGHLIHTYSEEVNPLPPFKGEPKRVSFSGDANRLSEHIWESLNAENRVALYVRFVDIVSGRAETRIINKLS